MTEKGLKLVKAALKVLEINPNDEDTSKPVHITIVINKRVIISGHWTIDDLRDLINKG